MSILNEILEVKKEEVEALRNKYSRSDFSDFKMFAENPLSFIKAISGKEGINIITEIKKASPSKGILKVDFDHIEIGKKYMANGANALSVLTDKIFFQGNVSFLNDLAKIKTVPLLRKDFIIDEFQILEARANGADSILLIAEALSKSQIQELTLAAVELKLDVLLEIHSPKQLDKIDLRVNKIIGINNRDLETFSVDLKTTIEISKLLSKEIIIVSESGISSKENIDELKQTKINAVLVGEHFMKSENIENSLRQFVKWCRYEG